MKLKEPGFFKRMETSENGFVEIELDRSLVEKLKSKYGTDTLEEVHIQQFLKDAIRSSEIKEAEIKK